MLRHGGDDQMCGARRTSDRHKFIVWDDPQTYDTTNGAHHIPIQCTLCGFADEMIYDPKEANHQVNILKWFRKWKVTDPNNNLPRSWPALKLPPLLKTPGFAWMKIFLPWKWMNAEAWGMAGIAVVALTIVSALVYQPISEGIEERRVLHAAPVQHGKIHKLTRVGDYYMFYFTDKKNQLVCQKGDAQIKNGDYCYICRSGCLHKIEGPYYITQPIKVVVPPKPKAEIIKTPEAEDFE